MKLSELETLPLNSFGTEDVIMVNQVISENDNKKIKKTPVHINTFAAKEDVASISDQCAQIIKLLSALTTKVNNIEKRIKSLEQEQKQIEINQKILDDNNSKFATLLNDEILTY